MGLGQSKSKTQKPKKGKGKDEILTNETVTLESSSYNNNNATTNGSTTNGNGNSTSHHTSAPTSHHTNNTHNSATTASHTSSNSSTRNATPTTSTSPPKEKEGDKNKRLEEFYDKYKDPQDPSAIGPDGVIKLCKDLNVEPEDIIVLVLAWHLNAKNMGFFSKSEFIDGLSKLGIDTLTKLQSHLPNFKKELDDQNNFKEIYRFAFIFSKENENNKILELESACNMISLVLCLKYPHISSLVDYLMNHQKTYRGLNMDQWLSIFEFAKVISPDVSNYDENGAWPVFLDSYCNWIKTGKVEE